jgi:hypothetical protein
MSVTPLESDGRAAASKAERAGSIPARGTPRAHNVAGQAVPALKRHVIASGQAFPSPSAAVRQAAPMRAPFVTHEGSLCQQSVGIWPGGLSGVAGLGWTVLEDRSLQLPGHVAVQEESKLERPEPRSGEDERA